MQLSQLKFIAAPYVDVIIHGSAFRIWAVFSPSPDAESGSKAKAYFIGVIKGGSSRGEVVSRFSKKRWDTMDDAYKAWWQGSTVDPEFNDADVLAGQLIEDGAAVAI